ncbi:MAG: hypothetical protein FJW27_12815 [Acidimicrobiia bacterium]|nr:hypothetical protein [Acidimicrobiia bacterium]
MNRPLQGAMLIALGAVIGGLAVSQWDARLAPSTTVAGQTAATPSGGASHAVPPAEGTLEADVAALKDARPSQSHAMMDVGYQFANLWFAAEKTNWPLARFYFNETRSHIRWTIRLRPIRKHPDGSPVDLKAIYDAIETSSMETLKQAIEAKDSTKFVSAYRLMMESCYACHKANGFDYLRPQVPTRPPQTVINYDPNATWPQ